MNINIIAEAGAIVNITQSKVEEVYTHEVCKTALKVCKTAQNHGKKGSDFDKMRNFRRQAIGVAARLRALGYTNRSIRMHQCGSEVVYEMCPECGRTHIISSNLCRDKICPVCGWRLSLRRFAELCTVMGRLQADLDWSQITPQMLTLTVINPRPADLGACLDAMQRAQSNMLKRRTIKKTLLGWARTLEITYNMEKRTFHPHYHYILLTHRGMEADEAEWRIRWMDALGSNYLPQCNCHEIVPRDEADDIELRADAIVDAVAEVAKYSIRPEALDDMRLSHLRHLIEALQGRRMVGYAGVIKEARKGLGMIDEEALGDEEDAKQAACICGANMALAVARWQWGEGCYRHEIITDGGA